VKRKSGKRGAEEGTRAGGGNGGVRAQRDGSKEERKLPTQQAKTNRNDGNPSDSGKGNERRSQKECEVKNEGSNWGKEMGTSDPDAWRRTHAPFIPASVG